MHLFHNTSLVKMLVAKFMLYLQIYLAIGYTIPQDSIKLFLYNKTDNDTIEITNNLFDLKLNIEKPLKILCHGLAKDSTVDWYQYIIQAYASMDYNVIGVDWALYSFTGYVKAISVSQDIGSFIGDFVIQITNTLNMSLSDVHLIGHSLGGHIAGFAGKYVFKQLAKKVGRITGLDPAGPLYNYKMKNERLSDDDALLVDVIHTNAGVLGISPSIGHMDFYPDGGINQNRCPPYEIECNHNMASRYFAESIGRNHFIAVLCDSYISYISGRCSNNEKALMGDNCRLKVRGDYFLNTTS